MLFCFNIDEMQRNLTLAYVKYVVSYKGEGSINNAK